MRRPCEAGVDTGQVYKGWSVVEILFTVMLTLRVIDGRYGAQELTVTRKAVAAAWGATVIHVDHVMHGHCGLFLNIEIWIGIAVQQTVTTYKRVSGGIGIVWQRKRVRNGLGQKSATLNLHHVYR